jgi:Icc-related predicted phosphoesterase
MAADSVNEPSEGGQTIDSVQEPQTKYSRQEARMKQRASLLPLNHKPFLSFNVGIVSDAVEHGYQLVPKIPFSTIFQSRPFQFGGGKKRMRIVMISDIHTEQFNMCRYHLGCASTASTLNHLPHGDLFIISGDVTHSGKLTEITLFRSFLNQLSKKYKNVVFIAGNHERTLDPIHYQNQGKKYHFPNIEDADLVRKVLLDGLFENIHYLQDSSVIIDGLKIYGTPWCAGGSDWAFSIPETKLVEKWNNIPRDTDILITHMPPYQRNDVVIEYHFKKDCYFKKSKGSISLLEKVKKVNPMVHIFGHYHDGYGKQW